MAGYLDPSGEGVKVLRGGWRLGFHALFWICVKMIIPPLLLTQLSKAYLPSQGLTDFQLDPGITLGKPLHGTFPFPIVIICRDFTYL